MIGKNLFDCRSVWYGWKNEIYKNVHYLYHLDCRLQYLLGELNCSSSKWRLLLSLQDYFFSCLFFPFFSFFVIRARPSPHPRLSVPSLARLVHQGVLANVVDADPKERWDIQDRSDLQAGVLSVFLANKAPWVRQVLWARKEPRARRANRVRQLRSLRVTGNSASGAN